MKYTNINFEEGLKREWIITNGIGGFASSTMCRSQYKKISRHANCTTNTTR